jgi:cation:H+ antiporter
MFLGGLILLVIGANTLVRGASKLAMSFGISPLVVGLTIVAFGTSAPEVAVSVGALLDGKTDIAIGNVVGSNIFNVLFILGISALIAPLVVNIQLIRQEVPIMLGASLLLLALLGLDGRVWFLDGALLFVLLVAYTVFLVVQSRRETQAAQDEFAAEMPPPDRNPGTATGPVQMLMIGVGLAALVFGSHWLVQAAVTFAKAMGVSDLVIGLTIVAAGTSHARGGHLHHGRGQGRARHRGGQCGGQQHLQHPRLPGPVGPGRRATPGWWCRLRCWPSTSG